MSERLDVYYVVTGNCNLLQHQKYEWQTVTPITVVLHSMSTEPHQVHMSIAELLSLYDMSSHLCSYNGNE